MAKEGVDVNAGLPVCLRLRHEGLGVYAVPPGPLQNLVQRLGEGLLPVFAKPVAVIVPVRGRNVVDVLRREVLKVAPSLLRVGNCTRGEVALTDQDSSVVEGLGVGVGASLLDPRPEVVVDAAARLLFPKPTSVGEAAVAEGQKSAAKPDRVLAEPGPEWQAQVQPLRRYSAIAPPRHDVCWIGG